MEVSEILECVDILAYISQYCELEERSDGEYWGLSPLKDENTPSFSVNTEKQRFYDFSSGQGGNVLDFIMKYHQCDFHKGLKLLKEFAKIEVDGAEGPCRRLLATKIAKRYAAPQRQEKEQSISVMSSDYMARFQWNEEKLAVWESEGISKESMRKFQVMYDPFSDRIVYPIRNPSGEIINVSGRTLDPDYKAKGLRKYTYFRSIGQMPAVVGLYENMQEIRAKNEIILFEGIKSVLQADTWGIRNTGAILTSHLNPQQFKILIRLGVRIVFALDAEVDIRKDANIMKLRPYANVEWVINRRGLLDDKDAPVDKGLEVFQTLYDERRRLR